MPNTVACETLDAMCSVCKVHCATWRAENADGDGYWTLDAWDKAGERWVVHHDGLLEAVCSWARYLVSMGRAAMLWRGVTAIDSLSLPVPGNNGYEVCSSGG